MRKGDALYVGHMLDTARRALRLAAGKNRADFDADEPLRLALTHLLQVIGEAARHVSPQFRSAHPQVPWQAIIGMRHRVVHDYINVNEDIVWATVTQELEPLVSQLAPIAPPGDTAA